MEKFLYRKNDLKNHDIFKLGKNSCKKGILFEYKKGRNSLFLAQKMLTKIFLKQNLKQENTPLTSL